MGGAWILGELAPVTEPAGAGGALKRRQSMVMDKKGTE